MSERWGGKYFYGLGIGATALFTVLTPVATRGLDLAGILVVRFLEGLFEVRPHIDRILESALLIVTMSPHTATQVYTASTSKLVVFVLYECICRIESLIIVECPAITIESMINGYCAIAIEKPSPWRL